MRQDMQKLPVSAELTGKDSLQARIIFGTMIAMHVLNGLILAHKAIRSAPCMKCRKPTTKIMTDRVSIVQCSHQKALVHSTPTPLPPTSLLLFGPKRERHLAAMPARAYPWEPPFASIGSLQKGDVIKVVSDERVARAALSFVKKPPKDRGLKPLHQVSLVRVFVTCS